MVRRPENDESASDEIRREDGAERYWLYYNGEWVETICGLCAAIGGVFWCFLWILGYSQTIVGYVLASVAILGFIAWRMVFWRINELQRSGWARERRNTRANEQKKIVLAILLWGFIVLFVGSMVLTSYSRPH